MTATWRSLGALCRELDWSRPRALHELQNGLPYRTVPPGHTVDWYDPNVLRGLDVEASTVTITRGVRFAEGEACFVLGLDQLTVGIEVLPPTDAAAPEPPPLAVIPCAPATPPPRNVSEADVRKAVLAVVDEHPQGSPPLDEDGLRREVERRVGAPVARDRVLAVRNEAAPQFKRPVGRPRRDA
jgi:hypothetical protein